MITLGGRHILILYGARYLKFFSTLITYAVDLGWSSSSLKMGDRDLLVKVPHFFFYILAYYLFVCKSNSCSNTGVTPSDIPVDGRILWQFGSCKL